MPRPLPPLWLAHSSRFAGLSRRRALWVVAALVVLIVASLTALGAPLPSPDDGQRLNALGPLALYESVIDSLRAGGDYYQLTADALRAGGYPLRPFTAFRLPAHSIVQAELPRLAAIGLLGSLAVAVAAAWWVRLSRALPRTPARVSAAVLLAGGLATFVNTDLIALHELWAAQLVALSLALRTPTRWLAPVAIALLAMLIRETAVLYVLVMAGMALIERRRGEAFGWLGALVLFAVALVAHAYGVAQVMGPLDPAVTDWAGMLGFGFFVHSVAAVTALDLLPLAVAGPLVALALFGWACWRDPLALRALAIFSAYALALGLVVQPDSFYWGLMVAPVILVGLAFAPDGLRDLAHALLDRRRVRVQRIAP